VMMAAMMLPSLVPALMRYRRLLRSAGRTRLGIVTALAGAGYFFVWAVVGMAIYPIGLALAEIAMRQPGLSRAVPTLTGLVVLAAAVVQFTAWKARRLACCRASHSVGVRPGTAGAAWRHGMRLGFDCVRCCGNLMAILVVMGVMDLSVMAAVTVAITLERLVPALTLRPRQAFGSNRAA